MKAPEYQRMEALEIAIRAAADVLTDPIEGVEVTQNGIVAWASGRFILLDYRWNQSHGERGEPLPGSGHWSAEYVRDCDVSLLRHGGQGTHRPWWRIW